MHIIGSAMQSESFVFLLLFTLILIIPVCCSSTCMADCTSELTQHPPSLYEQYCCNDNNTEKTFKIRQNNVLKIIFCSDNSPISCEMYRTFLNCPDIFKHNRSALSGYYTMRAPNGSLISVYCDLSFLSCSQILHVNSSATSGYYTIQAPNGSHISVYCDMEGSNCDGKGGWMRVGYINMSEHGATCPPGLTLHQYNNIDHGLCSRPVSSSGSSASVFFSTYGVIYNKVCGRVIGYQYESPDSFPPNLGGGYLYNPNIDNIYVDGVSITYDNNPRKHVWTLGVGWVADNAIVYSLSCPCNINNTETTVPSFIGSNYYCESGIASGYPNSVLYANDPLWDGQQCGGLEGPCCTNFKMPWFIKTLNETTTEDIELRVMADEGTNNEDIPLDIIELYIH